VSRTLLESDHAILLMTLSTATANCRDGLWSALSDDADVCCRTP
jgi:hypothetical protein